MILQIISASKKDYINSTNEARFPYIRSTVCCKNSAVTDTINIAQISWEGLKMLKSHICILQYLEEPDLPSAFQNEPISFQGKQISYLVLSCTGKDKAETYFLVITTVKTRGCCQRSHRCCVVTVVLPPPLHSICGNQSKARCSLHLEQEREETVQFWCS